MDMADENDFGIENAKKKLPPRPHNKIFNSVDYQKPANSMRKMKLANRHIYAYDDRNDNTIQNDDAPPYMSYNSVGPDHPAIYRSHRRNNRSDFQQLYGRSLNKNNSERVLFNASEVSLKDAQWKNEPITNTNMNMKKQFLSQIQPSPTGFTNNIRSTKNFKLKNNLVKSPSFDHYGVANGFITKNNGQRK